MYIVIYTLNNGPEFTVVLTDVSFSMHYFCRQWSRSRPPAKQNVVLVFVWSGVSSSLAHILCFEEMCLKRVEMLRTAGCWGWRSFTSSLWWWCRKEKNQMEQDGFGVMESMPNPIQTSLEWLQFWQDSWIGSNFRIHLHQTVSAEAGLS